MMKGAGKVGGKETQSEIRGVTVIVLVQDKTSCWSSEMGTDEEDHFLELSRAALMRGASVRKGSARLKKA